MGTRLDFLAAFHRQQLWKDVAFETTHLVMCSVLLFRVSLATGCHILPRTEELALTNLTRNPILFPPNSTDLAGGWVEYVAFPSGERNGQRPAWPGHHAARLPRQPGIHPVARALRGSAPYCPELLDVCIFIQLLQHSCHAPHGSPHGAWAPGLSPPPHGACLGLPGSETSQPQAWLSHSRGVYH